MILLDRYLFKQFTSIMVLVLTALLAIYLLVDFFERIDDFMQKLFAEVNITCISVTLLVSQLLKS